MSVLTKILVVILAFSTFFLCASVVTYVVNADNYKKQFEDAKKDLEVAKKGIANAEKQLEESKTANMESEQKLKNSISDLQIQITKLSTDLDKAEREKAEFERKVNSWTSITKEFYETTDKQGELLKNTLAELNNVQAEQIKEQKELNDVSAKLLEGQKIIEILEVEKKRLIEEKVGLEAKLNEYLLPGGKTAVVENVVTPEKTDVEVTTDIASAINLKGLVTEVDLKNSMAGISLGTADGVKKGMRFHVTRGNSFVCDIVIIDIDAEASVGVLELIQEQLKVGDSVATNL